MDAKYTYLCYSVRRGDFVLVATIYLIVLLVDDTAIDYFISFSIGYNKVSTSVIK